MRANKNLLWMKYARVVELFAQKAELSLDQALCFFYASPTYQLLKNGISDLHCMSDDYIAEELCDDLMRAKMI